MNANKTTRTRLLIAAALGILAVYALLSVLDARAAESRLAQARGDLAEVQGKLADIDRLKRAPKIAALQLESPAEITNRIAAALQVAGLSKSSLLKEEPLDPQRIQRTDFDQRITTIDLTPATLSQIIKFCDALRDEETGTVVRDITLSEPQGEENGGAEEKWETELVLTQMIFSPKSR
jgi:hypothetical protein